MSWQSKWITYFQRTFIAGKEDWGYSIFSHCYWVYLSCLSLSLFLLFFDTFRGQWPKCQTCSILFTAFLYLLYFISDYIRFLNQIIQSYVFWSYLKWTSLSLNGKSFALLHVCRDFMMDWKTGAASVFAFTDKLYKIMNTEV